MAVIYSDVYGSIARRSKQDEKDAAEIAKPVRSIYSGAAEGAYLALRPLEERAAGPREKTDPEIAIRAVRKAYRKRRINKAEMRQAIRFLKASGSSGLIQIAEST